MTPERWRDVERLFHAALERRPEERVAFLVKSCEGDGDLYREVQSLLDESSPSDAFLEGPPLRVAAPSPDADASVIRPPGKFGDYEIRSVLGVGGMGEVYRARDLKLGRDVAIKVLPARVASDGDRVSRFRLEAQILATLNHPNIGAIYSLVDHDGLLGLVLELVDGPTLADRLQSGPLPLKEAIGFARQTAEALHAAHTNGIVHRDLKPANIKITPGGTVKVLDFGLAKATDDSPMRQLSQVATMEATHAGMVLGTAAYMSPEQARGLPVDARSDIWAFGCVLYESLTGRRPFHGRTPTDCLAAILHAEPDWTAVPRSVPPGVVDLLKHCLAKEAQARPQTMREVQDALPDPAFVTGNAVPVTRPAVSWSRRTWTWVTAAALLVVAVGFGAHAIRQSRLEPSQVGIDLADGQFIAPTQSSEVAISPAGDLIAYASVKGTANMADMSAMGQLAGQSSEMSGSMPAMTMTQQLYVRPVAAGEARPIGGALGSAPFFSPDGTALGFWHAPSGTLRRVALSGGSPVRIADAITGVAGAAWGPDQTIVFAWFHLYRVPASGGSPERLLEVDEARGERFLRHPSFLPSGKAVLFTIGMADTYSYDDARIGIFSLDSREKKILIEGGSSAKYSPSGHIVYARDGKLLAVPFDVDLLQLTGDPFPVAEGVFMSANTGMAAYSISAEGRLVYAAGPVERGSRVPVWVDRQGQAKQIPVEPHAYLHPRLSSDGRLMAIEIEGASHDIFVYDFAREILTRMSLDGASHWPLFTPNDQSLTYRSWKTGTMTMWKMPVDRSGVPALLTDIGGMQSPESWSPDGRTLAFTQMDKPDQGSDIHTLHADGKQEAVVQTKFSEGSPKFSPDGRWLAYASDESGRSEVYVMAFPGPGQNIKISGLGGSDPVWRRDGAELYYRNADQMMVVGITTRGTSITASKPTMLWEGKYLAGAGSSCGMSGPTSANYDVTAHGDRFVMIMDVSPDVKCTVLRVVSNWSRGLMSPRADLTPTRQRTLVANRFRPQ